MLPIEQMWLQDFYDDLLAEMLLVRSVDELQTTTDFLIAQGKLDSTDPTHFVFDQCCGIGNVAIHLAKQGFAVVGVDQATRYIERAQRDAAHAGVDKNTYFAAHDAGTFAPLDVTNKLSAVCKQKMQDLPPDPPDPPVGAYRLVYNWWTGFGHGKTDDDNIQMLQRAYECLSANGTLILDYLHVPAVLKHLQRDVTTEKQTPLGFITLNRRTSVDLLSGRMKKVWRYFVEHDDGRISKTEYTSDLRLYTSWELHSLLQKAGFSSINMYGDLSLSPLSLDTLRCICIAKKL